jgi:hypothetical protein
VEDATMTVQQIYILGTDGNLWLAGAPFGKQIPPLRTQVDGNVSYFNAFSAQQVLVLGGDSNLWLEVGPFGQVPLTDTSTFPPSLGTRYQIDGSVGGFSPWSPEEVFVLGNDDNAWLEFSFGTTIPTVPPPRTQIDGSVDELWPISLQELYVLGNDGNLWHELGPYGTVPLPPCNGGTAGCRTQVDADVAFFTPVDSTHVFVADRNNNLWLDQGDWGSIPPLRTAVDGNVADFLAVDAETVYVLGTDGNLWLENAPFGTVPLPLCSETSGFGQGFGCRTLIASNVLAFDYFPDAGGLFFIDGNDNLWQASPLVQIDGNVYSFQPLAPEQSLMAKRLRKGTTAQARPPLGRPRSRLARRA